MGIGNYVTSPMSPVSLLNPVIQAQHVNVFEFTQVVGHKRKAFASRMAGNMDYATFGMEIHLAS